VKKSFRLRRPADFIRVRRSGKSFAHPLLVLYVLKASEMETHVGVSAGLAVGNAVKRNRAKRILRVAMNELLPSTQPGYELLLIARTPLSGATVQQTREALTELLKRASLLS
jgi:ribonuclease P protein component